MSRSAGRARRAASSWRHTKAMRLSSDPADVESVTVRYLMYVLMPAWFVPAVADYLMHRRTRIERTSGLGESAIHALMITLVFVISAGLCAAGAVLISAPGRAGRKER